MPHTNRKKKASDGKVRADPKKKFSHSKREYISSEDGWTQVADKGWKSTISKDKLCTGLQNPLVDMTLEEMVQEHERYKKQWESSDACAKLKNILSVTENEGRCAVGNAICLGLGSLQALSMEWRRSSHTQLAALTTIRDALNLTCQVTMQDPRFTDLDKSFFKSMGCELVDHPEAFQHINKNSLVYAIHCPFQLLWKVKERIDPALLIVNDLRNSSFKEMTYTPDVPDQTTDEKMALEESQKSEEEKGKSDMERYEETCSLIQDCEEIAFPQLRYDFSATVIYWRRLQNSTNT